MNELLRRFHYPLTYLLLALLCVFFVMASLFESLVHPGIVMGCVPFASLGVVWLMMATGTPFKAAVDHKSLGNVQLGIDFAWGQAARAFT